MSVIVGAALGALGGHQIMQQVGPVIVGYPSAPPQDAQSVPLRTAPEAPAGEGGYAYLDLRSDRSGLPVRWDSCRPIHYVLSEEMLPNFAPEAVAEALDEVGRHSGLTFVYDGLTSERPDPDRSARNVDLYGSGWSPVLVAWVDPESYAPVSGFVGLGGPSKVRDYRDGMERYVSGMVVFNRNYTDQLSASESAEERLGAVLRHEFSHLVGLDHVSNEEALMNPVDSVAVRSFSPGDLRGLAGLAQGPCSALS